jgi:cell division protein FtsI (penicillin-binding protein 3)
MDGIINYFSRKLSLFHAGEEVSKFRLYFIFFAFIGLFSILGVRLFFLTIVPNLSLGSENKASLMSSGVIGRRDIVDRNGEMLATNITTSSVYANTKLIPNHLEVARKLKVILPSLSFEELHSKLKSDKSFVWIKRFITPEEHQKINDLGIPGLYFEEGERRAYPYTSLFSHVIGSVGLDGNGLSGVEKSLDKGLRYFKGEVEKAPLQLSLDLRIQNIVREELLASVKTFSARGGVGIVQDPNNGEILAIVSLPDFDPYNIANANDEQLFNRATLGSYEVGSVFKPFTVASAIDAGKIGLTDVYDVNDPIQLSKYQIRDLHKKNAFLSVPEILMYSSNIGMAQIALELGKKDQYEYLDSLGLFRQIDIELPEKSKPLRPNLSKWSNISAITISYGNGIAVSPLHVVQAMSALINGGKLYSTTLLKREKEAEYTKVFKESTSNVMRKLYRLIVKYGSGKKAEVDGYFTGGKTGTSNKIVDGKYSKTLRVSSFIGAFPIYNPKYVIYVMLDEPKGTKETFGFALGGWNAAPTVARIIKRITMLYNIPPALANKEKIENYLHVDYDSNRRML